MLQGERAQEPQEGCGPWPCFQMGISLSLCPQHTHGLWVCMSCHGRHWVVGPCCGGLCRSGLLAWWASTVCGSALPLLRAVVGGWLWGTIVSLLIDALILQDHLNPKINSSSVNTISQDTLGPGGCPNRMPSVVHMTYTRNIDKHPPYWIYLHFWGTYKASVRVPVCSSSYPTNTCVQTARSDKSGPAGV